jgi:hypothetical protein
MLNLNNFVLRNFNRRVRDAVDHEFTTNGTSSSSYRTAGNLEYSFLNFIYCSLPFSILPSLSFLETNLLICKKSKNWSINLKILVSKIEILTNENFMAHKIFLRSK